MLTPVSLSSARPAPLQPVHSPLQHHLWIPTSNGTRVYREQSHNIHGVKFNLILTFIVHQDVALLDKLIKEDLETGKLPLLLIANAGEWKSLFTHHRSESTHHSVHITEIHWDTSVLMYKSVNLLSHEVLLLCSLSPGTPGAGHTDKLGRLKDLCDQYSMWLHVEGWVPSVTRS